MPDEEVKVEIKSEYDPAGAEKAKQDLEKLAEAQQEANKPAANATPTQENLPVAKGRDKEMQQSELLKKAMQMETGILKYDCLFTTLKNIR